VEGGGRLVGSELSSGLRLERRGIDIHFVVGTSRLRERWIVTGGPLVTGAISLLRDTRTR
jgi:hypothetical protein